MDLQARIDALEAEFLAKDRLLAEQAAENAKLRALVTELLEEQARLREQIEALTEQLGRDSRNSNQPPSSDAPGRKRRGSEGEKPKRGQQNRKRGGQVGHSGAHRRLVPVEQVHHGEDVFPSRCESCWKDLPQIPDPKAKRYQVTEVPPLEPVITEYRRHAVRCTCGYTTQTSFEESQIPRSVFGPRLMSLVVLLTGVYHVSRRKTAKLLQDLCGVRISLGSISAIETGGKPVTRKHLGAGSHVVVVIHYQDRASGHRPRSLRSAGSP